MSKDSVIEPQFKEINTKVVDLIKRLSVDPGSYALREHLGETLHVYIHLMIKEAVDKAALGKPSGK